MTKRFPTTPPEPTAEHNAYSLEMLWGRMDSVAEKLDSLNKETRKTSDLLVELSGRYGQGGKLQELKIKQEKSAASQGQRLEDHSKEISALKQLKAQLYLIAAIGGALLAALAKAVISNWGN